MASRVGHSGTAQLSPLSNRIKPRCGGLHGLTKRIVAISPGSPIEVSRLSVINARDIGSPFQVLVGAKSRQISI